MPPAADFSEKNYGVSSFGKLLALLESRYQKICLVNDSYTLKVGLVRERDARTPQGDHQGELAPGRPGDPEQLPRERF